MQSLLVLGRQPALGLAELESLYGAEKLEVVGDRAAIVDVDPCLMVFDRLGGSLRFCKLLTTLETTDWHRIEKFLVDVSPAQSEKMPAGKMQLGLSVIGLDVTVKQLQASGLALKKAIRLTGRNVRLVPNKDLELNTAQVLHNHLAGQTGWELLLIRDRRRTLVAQTVKIQDIESYGHRDRARPKRDTRVGMLPPKLAQIVVNLAAGRLPEDKLRSICEIPAGRAVPSSQPGQTVLDPFCGTGVTLQEAILMGYDAYGTDLEPRMVDYTKQNLDWLSTAYGLTTAKYSLEPGDATIHRWGEPVDMVASETYLGRPFTAAPTPEILARTTSECNLIISRFLKNIGPQLKPGTRLCLAVPAWQTKPGQFRHLPLIDSLSDLGYNRVKLAHVRHEDLLYFRSGQIVARELLVIIRK